MDGYHNGKLLKSVQNFYAYNNTCVRVGMNVAEWFLVNAGLRLGCVMSLPWLFNVFIEDAMRCKCYGVWERAGVAEC